MRMRISLKVEVDPLDPQNWVQLYPLSRRMNGLSRHMAVAADHRPLVHGWGHRSPQPMAKLHSVTD
jgi:hypothetical protein